MFENMFLKLFWNLLFKYDLPMMYVVDCVFCRTEKYIQIYYIRMTSHLMFQSESAYLALCGQSYTKCSTIVNYDSWVIIKWGIFKSDTTLVEIYDCRAFIRLTIDHTMQVKWNTHKGHFSSLFNPGQNGTNTSVSFVVTKTLFKILDHRSLSLNIYYYYRNFPEGWSSRKKSRVGSNCDNDGDDTQVGKNIYKQVAKIDIVKRTLSSEEKLLVMGQKVVKRDPAVYGGPAIVKCSQMCKH